MLERASEANPAPEEPPGNVIVGRFARDPEHFAVGQGPEAVVEAALAAAVEDDA